MIGGFAAFTSSTQNIALGIGDSLLLSWNAFLAWVPNIIGAFIILIIGIYIAQLVRAVVKRILEGVKFEQWINKFGVGKMLKSGGIKISISEVIVWLIYWVVALVFLNSASQVLGIPSITEFIEKLVDFIPRVFAGLVIMILGVVAARAVGDVLEKVSHGKTYKTVAYWVILVVAFVTALEQLGFNIDFLKENLNIIMMGIMLAVGLAFGLGGKEKAKQIIEKHLN